MAFELPNLPSFQVNTPQMPSPLDAYGKMLQLKQLSGQQQLLPLEIQEQQAKVQAAQTQNQMQQLAYKTQLAEAAYWSNPSQFDSSEKSPMADRIGSMLGLSADDPITKMVQGMVNAAAKNGVSPAGAFVQGKAMLEMRRTAQQGNSEQQKIHTDALATLGQIAAPVVSEKDPQKKAAALQAALPGLMAAASYDPDLKQAVAGLLPDGSNLNEFVNRIGKAKDVLEYQEAGAKTQAAQQKVINPQTGMSPEQAAQATADVAKAQALQPLEVEKAKEVEKVHAQVEASMLPLTEQIRQTFANQKDAQDKIATQVFKPYQDKMTDVTMARNALSQAQDNPVAARAAIFKMIGVSQPTGSHRVLPAEITAFQYPGGVGTKIQEKFHNFLKGEPWTPEIAQAANAFIDGQDRAAKQSLNEGIVNTNKIYGTNVSTGLMQQMTRTYQGHTYVQQSDGSWKLQGK